MEKYVSLEIAILLKDKNFNLKTHHYFGKHKYDKKKITYWIKYNKPASTMKKQF